MGLLKYFRAVFKEAFSHAFSVADFVSSAIGFLLPPLWRWFRLGGDIMDSAIAWQIPACAFGFFFVLRLILAPYWMHKEVEAEKKKLEGQMEAASRCKLMVKSTDLNAIPLGKDPIRHLRIAIVLHNTGDVTLRFRVESFLIVLGGKMIHNQPDVPSVLIYHKDTREFQLFVLENLDLSKRWFQNYS
jgi:hypothetical protein